MSDIQNELRERQDDKISLICPNCGKSFTVPSHTTSAENGDYRPCSWDCRSSSQVSDA